VGTRVATARLAWHEEARALYKETAQRWTDYGFVLEEVQAHLGLAAASSRSENKRGHRAAPKARAIFSQLGAVPLLNETEAQAAS
jgi:hypothetical protein